MSKILIFLSLISYSTLFSQTNTTDNPLEKGLLFNCSVGFSNLLLVEQNATSFHASLSLPNISFGYRFNQKVAIFLHLPGTTFKSAGKTRGFEGILLGSQFWFNERWWIKGGIGLCLDAPAFWTVDNPNTADFRIEFPETMIGAGYEFYRGKKLIIDAQYKCYFGGTKLSQSAARIGVSNSIGIGFNWY